MLYTRKGDGGTTKAFDSKPGERISKSSCRTEALGALDELNSFIGIAKMKAQSSGWTVELVAGRGMRFSEVCHWVQECLFIVQAEVAGADKHINEEKIVWIEHAIDSIEKSMPPIKTFFISGGTELAATFDVCRTLARKAERRVVAGVEQEQFVVVPTTLAFLNRLSSLFYALARLTNHKSGITEQSPRYQ